ncbi:AAA family ATPase [Erysipelotrichaceae bacterium Oil+RF-744-GAM-WT-6]|uniref:AAA family ATPase n=1 Tax=Stecheria intestinalis TaxID=2606630 RepID=A0A7X2NRY3_9FIRM|nr:RNA-binding domain-containing protein [Stecheria intestinalis]MSS58404.1 AAA family ATPase [Stecheria intestinalis]
MTEKEILDSLKYGEKINLECKKAESKIPNSVWETYSSFANTDGGLILFGVEEHLREKDPEKRFTLESITNPQQKLTDFWNTINSAKVSTNILVDSDVGICKVRGADIMWINVPQADYKAKPVYINENINKGTFKRNHEGDYHCTVEEIKAMLRDASDSGNDGTLLVNYTMDDIDAASLKSYRIEFEHNNPDHVWNGVDDETFLKNMGGFAVDRKTKKGWLTAAGLLMFGKGLAIRERFDNIRMDYLDESNLAPGSRWSDRLTYDGMWENNLYSFMRLVMPKLVSGIKRPFNLQGMARNDDTAIHKAIREAVVNMLIHSDYQITGVLSIVKEDKGFCFSNPGSLKLPIRAIYEGGHSVARNPRIQIMLRMIGYGDNIGSGFPTILSAWGDENWRKPDLSQDEELHQVTLKLWMISTMPKECTDHLKKLFGSVYTHLSQNEQLILGTAYLEGSVTNSRLQALLDLHSTDVGHLLSDLTARNLLLVNWKGRWSSYQVNENYQPEAEQIDLSDISTDDQNNLRKSDQMIYEYICTNGFITSSQVISLVPNITTKSGATAALRRLIKDQLVEKVREGRQFIYKKK